jgi:hypothetical protein
MSRMKQQCEKEMLVARGIRSGFWDSELERHVATCSACSETALAARALNEMRAVDEAEAHVPDAALMWWKAQLAAKRQAGERATQPIHLVERFACALAAVCVAGACIWQGHAVREWLEAVGRLGVRTGIDSLESVVAYFAQIRNQAALAGSAFDWSGLVMAGGAGVLLVVVAFFAVYFSQSED